MKKENFLVKIILPIITLIIIIGLWDYLSAHIENLPSPKDVWISAFGGTLDGQKVQGVLTNAFHMSNDAEDKGIFWQVMASLGRVFAGFILAVIVGVLIGFMIGMSKKFYYALNPYIQILKPVSPLAWLPLFLLIFQAINPTAIATIFITSIWPIISNTVLGVQSVNKDYINVARVLKFSPIEMVYKIMLPVSVPYIFSGMRLSLGIAWLVIVAAEMLTGGTGIGFWIWDEYNNLNYPNIILGIFIVGIVGWILDSIMGKIADFFDYRKRGRA